VIDFSTIDPAVSRSLGERLPVRACAYLDAPVTGGNGRGQSGSPVGFRSSGGGTPLADLEGGPAPG